MLPQYHREFQRHMYLLLLSSTILLCRGIAVPAELPPANAEQLEQLSMQLAGICAKGSTGTPHAIVDQVHAFRVMREKAVPLAKEIVTRDHTRLGYAAASALGCLAWLREKAPLDIFEQALQDKRALVLGVAIASLGTIHHPKVEEMLKRYLSDRETRVAALGAFINMNDPAGVSLLIEYPPEMGSENTQSIQWVKAVARTGCTDAWERVVKLTGASHDEEMRTLCVKALDNLNVLRSRNLKGELLARARRDALSEVLGMRTGDDPAWSIRQIRWLKLKDRVDGLVAILDEVKDKARKLRPEWTIQQSESAFELALTIHELGGKLKPEDEKMLASEGLID